MTQAEAADRSFASLRMTSESATAKRERQSATAKSIGIVMLSEAKHLSCWAEMLRFAQHDKWWG